MMTMDGTRAQVTEPRERRAPLRPDVRLPQEVREQNLEALSPSPREPERGDFPALLVQALDAQMEADLVYEDVVTAMDRHHPYAMAAIDTFRDAFDASGMTTREWVKLWLGALSERKKRADPAPQPIEGGA